MVLAYSFVAIFYDCNSSAIVHGRFDGVCFYKIKTFTRYKRVYRRLYGQVFHFTWQFLGSTPRLGLIATFEDACVTFCTFIFLILKKFVASSYAFKCSCVNLSRLSVLCVGEKNLRDPDQNTLPRASIEWVDWINHIKEVQYCLSTVSKTIYLKFCLE